MTQLIQVPAIGATPQIAINPEGEALKAEECFPALLQLVLKAAFDGPPFDMSLPIFGLQKNIGPLSL